MIIIRVELHSAINGKVSEIARMYIANVGGTKQSGDYRVATLRGRSKESLDKKIPQRTGDVFAYPRLRLHVWHLVAAALSSLGYFGKKMEVHYDDFRTATDAVDPTDKSRDS